MEPLQILFVLRLPARLTIVQVAILLNFHVDAIRHLVKIGLLEAIGETEDVELFFDAVYIDSLRHNSKRIAKCTKAWRVEVQKRNQAQAAKKKAKKETA